MTEDVSAREEIRAEKHRLTTLEIEKGRLQAEIHRLRQELQSARLARVSGHEESGERG